MNRIFVYLFTAACFLVFFSCQKEYSYEVGNTLPGEGSLWDSSGECLPSTVHGTFYNGVAPGSDTAYVEVQVIVTQTGSYNIKTEAEDGFSFADSGYFTTTGINTVRLKPIGIPIIQTTSTFTYGFDSTACTFTITIQDSTGTGLGGGSDTTGTGDSDSTVNIGDNSWQFVADGHTYSGSVLLAQLGPSISGSQLYIVGTMQSGSTDTAFGITVQYAGSTVETGDFVTSDAGTNFSLTKVASGEIVYAANVSNDEDIVTIKVLTYDTTTKVVTGTFSGDSYDFDGNKVPITNGQFKATLQ